MLIGIVEILAKISDDDFIFEPDTFLSVTIASNFITGLPCFWIINAIMLSIRDCSSPNCAAIEILTFSLASPTFIKASS